MGPGAFDQGPGFSDRDPVSPDENPASLDRPPASFDPVEVARRHPIAFEGPAVSFFEGGLLGNGGLGAVVTTRPDAVVVRFGHNNVWDVRIAEDNRDKIGTFQEVFEKVRRIPDSLASLDDDPWYREYRNMTHENYRKPYPRPFPCGSLVLGFDRRRSELLGHRVDIATGLCTVELVHDGRPVRAEIFAEAACDRLWIRLVDEDGRPADGVFNRIALLPDPETPGEFPPCRKRSSADMLSFEQVLPYEEPHRYDPAAGHPKDRAFRLSVRTSGPLAFRKRLVKHRFYEETADPSGCAGFAACVHLEEGLAADLIEGRAHAPDSGPDSHSHNSAEPQAAAAQQSAEALPVVSHGAFEEARTQTAASWRDYWRRSGVELEDAFLERIWYWNLYFLNCAVRPGTTCPGLFANWSYRKIGTAWHGDYHLDYNAQQPFWVSFSTNHVDKHLAYVDMIDRLRPVARRWAREYFGLRGACYPVTAYPVDMTMCPYPVPTWGWMISMTPWAVQSHWWHFYYTRDVGFLRERAFEPIKEAVMFVVDYMRRPEAHGPQWNDDRYHVFPTVPPELYALTPGFRFNYDCLVDLVLIRFLFKAFKEACRILGVEKDEMDLLAATEEILARLPDYPTADTPHGRVFVSVPGEDPEIVYNLPNSTFTVFPGEEHGLHSKPEEYELALNSYLRQRNEGGNELVLLNLVGARLGRLDLERFKRQIRYCLLPNGTCTDKVLEVDGRYDDNTAFDYMAGMGIWFENFALPAVINECLLQSYTGTLRLFPNWPENLRAEFRTLRAAGGFLVSALFDKGEVRWIRVESEAGAPLKLHNPWPKEAVCRRSDGTRSVHAGDTIELPTSPGDTLLFTRA